MPKITSVSFVPTVFDDIKAWYEKHLAPAVINFDDPLPYEVYSQAKWAGIFQCVEKETLVTLDDNTFKPIKQIVAGDMVKAYNEVSREYATSPVERVYDQGERECVELTFDDGRKLVLTDDHPVLTARGWVSAGELGSDDEVECFGTLP